LTPNDALPNNFYRLLFEKTAQGVLFQDADGKITGANKAADYILGLTAEELIGRTRAELDRKAISKDGAELPVDELPTARAMKTGLPVFNFIQGIYNPRLKSNIWVTVDAIPDFSPETGALSHILTIYTNINGQRIAEEAEKASMERIRKLLGDSKRSSLALMSVVEDLKSSGKALRDSNDRLEYLVHALKSLTASKTMEQMQEAITHSARNLVHSDSAALVMLEDGLCHHVAEDSSIRLWKGGKFSMDECVSGWSISHNKTAVIRDLASDSRVLTKHYASTPIKSLVMAPIFLDRPIGAIGAYWNEVFEPSPTDIKILQTLADSAAMSIENLKLVGDLEDRVRKRTADYEAANKELESFSYSVSHDLRAPLRAIDGYVRILQEDYQEVLDAEGKRTCGKISEGARRMWQLIDDLLLFSRTGKQPLVRKMIDMTALVRQAVEEILAPIAGKDYDIEIGALEPTIGDVSLIRQVWMNLIGNAVKFSRKLEKPRIRIFSERVEGEIVYTVEDNGAGFNMEYADKLFGVFQRLHGQNEFEGTGVGLALVKRIIARHGGRIWAEGQLDQGAKFHFSVGAEAADD
jgi:signal transduction histidine kinase